MERVVISAQQVPRHLLRLGECPDPVPGPLSERRGSLTTTRLVPKHTPSLHTVAGAALGWPIGRQQWWEQRTGSPGGQGPTDGSTGQWPWAAPGRDSTGEQTEPTTPTDHGGYSPTPAQRPHAGHVCGHRAVSAGGALPGVYPQQPTDQTRQPVATASSLDKEASAWGRGLVMPMGHRGRASKVHRDRSHAQPSENP